MVGVGLAIMSDKGEIFVGNVLTDKVEMDRIIRYKILLHHGLRSFIEKFVGRFAIPGGIAE